MAATPFTVTGPPKRYVLAVAVPFWIVYEFAVIDPSVIVPLLTVTTPSVRAFPQSSSVVPY